MYGAGATPDAIPSFGMGATPDAAEDNSFFGTMPRAEAEASVDFLNDGDSSATFFGQDRGPEEEGDQDLHDLLTNGYVNF
jgi:hypothetical protein